ncbi:MAG: hypothetical protein WBB23_06300 [Desulforhopalus sp.]
MNSLKFVDDMACIQRSVAQCHDQAVRRGMVIDVMQPQTGELVLEVGCVEGSMHMRWLGVLAQLGACAQSTIALTRSPQQKAIALIWNGLIAG